MENIGGFKGSCALLAALSLLAASCSSGDDDERQPSPPPDDGRTPSQNTLDPAANGFDPRVEGACMNESDRAGLTTEVDGLTVGGHASVCGLSCIQEEDECNDACLVARIGELLSNECRSCAVGVVKCVTQNCFSDCLDPRSEACSACACDVARGACSELFELCTGIENTDCG